MRGAVVVQGRVDRTSLARPSFPPFVLHGRCDVAATVAGRGFPPPEIFHRGHPGIDHARLAGLGARTEIGTAALLALDHPAVAVVVPAIRYQTSLRPARVARAQLVVGYLPPEPAVEHEVHAPEHRLLVRHLLPEDAVVCDDAPGEAGDVREFHLLRQIRIHLDAANAAGAVGHYGSVFWDVAQPLPQDFPRIAEVLSPQWLGELEPSHLRLVAVPAIEDYRERRRGGVAPPRPASFPRRRQSFARLPRLLQPAVPFQRGHVVPGVPPVERHVEAVRDYLGTHPNVQVPEGRGW